MILPNLRQRLTAADRATVLLLLVGNDRSRRPRYENVAAVRGLDALLDDEDLPGLLQHAQGLAAPSATLYIYVAVRHALLHAGIDDARLSDYLGALLYEFALRDRAWRIATHDDEQYRYLADILAAAEAAPGQRRFLLRVHLGNFSLWLAGVFPDYITTRRARRCGPGFEYYDTIGARGFRLASDDRYAHEFDVADVYAQVADRFAEIRVALNRLSDQAFFRDFSSPERLMRQVADEFRYPSPGGPLF